ncbi:hypothetical protein J3O30_08895 [Rhizobium sp. NZLR1]|nr:hypothetical protein J3O30_08895 [Rhizobium sp. NZLR1]
MAPLAAFLPTLGTPPAPAPVIIAPVGPTPITLIAPATVVTLIAPTAVVTFVTVAIMSPAITNLNDIALDRHGRPIDGHGGGRGDGRQSRTNGHGCGEKEMCELHGCFFLIDDEAKISWRG